MLISSIESVIMILVSYIIVINITGMKFHTIVDNVPDITGILL